MVHRPEYEQGITAKAIYFCEDLHFSFPKKKNRNDAPTTEAEKTPTCISTHKRQLLAKWLSPEIAACPA